MKNLKKTKQTMREMNRHTTVCRSTDMCMAMRLYRNIFAFAFAFAFFFAITAQSQTTVTQGLKIPRLDPATQRSQIPVSGNEYAKGQIIFNTENNCMEYWNGTRWVALCEGNSQMTVLPNPCQDVNADGTGCDDEFGITDPDCGSGPFSFAIVAGSDFVSFASTNEADGKFRLSFMPNNSVHSRSVVVRVTSSCTGLYKDFLFTQEGHECNPALGDAPAITAIPAAVGNNLDLCSGGAVYLSVPASTPNLGELIWTRNGAEFARGVNYIMVTQGGRYDISMGFVDCGNLEGNHIIINNGTTVAPFDVIVVQSESGGVICGVSGTVKLTAMGSPANVIWFHNGVPRTDKIGAVITLVASDAGVWNAAVSDGGSCYSRPSRDVEVVVDMSSSGQVPLNPADVKVNGVAIGSVTDYCPGGSLILSVDNQDAGVNYQWYSGNDEITSPYIVPADETSIFLRLVATDKANILCPAEENSAEKTLTGSAPDKPSVSGPSSFCPGSSATLTTTPVAGAQYEWFRNNVSLGGLSSNNFIEVFSDGNYQVRTFVDDCYSPLSDVRAVTMQGAPSIGWNNFVTSANTTSDYPFSVISTGLNAPTGYTWEEIPSGSAVITGSGQSVSIKFNTNSTIKVTPSNACGDGAAITHIVAIISTGLPAPVVSPMSGSSFCGGVNFTITRPASGWTDGEWLGLTASNIEAKRDGATVSGTLTNNGAPAATREYYYYVPATSSSNQTVTLNFKGAVASKPVTAMVSDASVTVRTSSESTINLIGQTCFDIAYVNEGASCGTLASRAASRANFGTSYAYELTGTLGAGVTLQSVVWSYVVNYGSTTASDAVSAFAQSAFSTSLTSNKVNVTFNPALLTNATLLKNGITITITATVTTSSGGCGTAVYTLTQEVTIRDCTCCGCNGTAIPMQIGSNTYLTHEYLTEGVMRCWMVENLKEVPASGSYWTTYSGKSAGERGYYYTWTAAQNACPSGWSLPTQEQLVGTNGTGTNGIFTTLSNTSTVGRAFWYTAPYALQGSRNTAATWHYWGNNGHWWSSASGIGMRVYSDGTLSRGAGSSAAYGFSVRCIKNQ